MSAFLEISQLTKIYDTPKGSAIIVQDFDLKIAKGEFVCIIGHSGCGKTTVLSMVAGLNQITSGVIVLAGKEVTGPGPDRGVVFQSPCLLPWLTAFENVMLGVDQVYYTASRGERHDIAEYYLSGSAWPRPCVSGRRNSLRACASGSVSPAPLRYRPRCCCSMSPSVCSIR